MKRNTMPKKESTDAPLALVQDVASVAVKIETALVEVQYIAEPTATEGYQGGRRVDIGLLTRDQLRKLRAIRRGYIMSNAKLANGNEVKSMADAVRALIDSVKI
jgi:hypothetical protein